MTIVEGRLGQLTVRDGLASVDDAKGKAGQVVLRTRSRRAYSCEVHPREAVSDLTEVAAVYAYARAVPANMSSADASGNGLEIGYVGKTDNMGRQDAAHTQASHFTGQGFDIVLILRIAQERFRADIARDLIETFNPVLNDLLRGVERGQVS